MGVWAGCWQPEMSTEDINSLEVWQVPWWHLKWPWGQGRSHWSPAKQACQGLWEQANRRQVHGKTIPGIGREGTAAQEAKSPELSIPFHGNLGLFGNLLPHGILALACLLNRPWAHTCGHGVFPRLSAWESPGLPSWWHPQDLVASALSSLLPCL